MQGIIPIFTSNFNNSQINSIDARKLHEFLLVKKDFSNWIKNRLKDFIENEDYIRFAQKGEANNATKIDYTITLDVAKHISMVERNAKGKEARQYFIDIEKQANNQTQQPKIDSQFLAQITEQMRANENLIAEQKTSIEKQDNTINAISNIQETYSVREASKNLLVKESDLREFLKLRKWIQYLSDGGKEKKAYSTFYSKDNHFAKDTAVLNKARQKYYHQFRITKHGMEYLIKKREEILIINLCK